MQASSFAVHIPTTLSRLTLAGHLDHGAAIASKPQAGPSSLLQARIDLLVPVAAALFVAGFGFTNVTDAAWGHVLGGASYLAFVALAFGVAVPLP